MSKTKIVSVLSCLLLALVFFSGIPAHAEENVYDGGLGWYGSHCYRVCNSHRCWRVCRSRGYSESDDILAAPQGDCEEDIAEEDAAAVEEAPSTRSVSSLSATPFMRVGGI